MGSVEKSMTKKFCSVGFKIFLSNFCCILFRRFDPEMSFLKQFAAHLEEHHLTEDFDTIYQMTRQEFMASVQVDKHLSD